MERTISLPDELFVQIEGTAARQGKSLDKSIRAQIDERSWQDLLDYGHQTGPASGYSEADVPGIVRKRRRIVSGRG